ncbi:MAG: DUF3467 domain-containing protein [Proteobacteria bacterium]|nr:DUF3467 domain-containing protein [Pseudomonadota bacterium]
MELNQLSEITTIDVEKKDAIPTIYCNQIRVVMSQWDMTIEVGEANFSKMTEGENGKKNLPVEFKARIVMSPQHGKAVAQVLMDQIKKYEDDFGELKILLKQPK